MQVGGHRAHELEPRAAHAAEVREQRRHGIELQRHDRLHRATGLLARVAARLRAGSRGTREQDQRQARQNAKPATAARFDTNCHELRLSSSIAERTMNAKEPKAAKLRCTALARET